MSDSIYKPVQLAARSRQGMLLSMDGTQLATLLVAAGIVWLTVVGLGPLGFLVSVPIAAPIAATALIRVHGFPVPTMLGRWLMKKTRTAMGGTREVFRPEAMRQVGTLRLPGSSANLQFWDVDGMVSVYQPGARSSTVSVTCELEVAGFLMKDIADRFQVSDEFSKVLASMTQRPGVKRVVLQERTTPTTIQAARDRFAAVAPRRRRIGGDAATENYLDVLDGAESFAVVHRNFITTTLDLVSMSGQMKALGGGKKAAQALAAVEARNMATALQSAGFKVRRWLSPRDMAGLARTAFDPDFLSTIQNRTNEEQRGVDLTAMGPMHLEEPSNKHGLVITDSGVHSTMWIHEWPRMASRVGFIEPVVFSRDPVTGDAITHILSVVATPLPVSKALKSIQRDKASWKGNQKLRARRGEEESASDRADWAALEDREEQIVSGHGQFSYGGYLTITARDEDALERGIAGARNAMSQVGMEGQILYCQQAEALMTNVLPLGIGMN